MVRLDHPCALAVAPLHVSRESVVHARIDLELVDPPRRELALDRGDHRPHQTLPAVCGIDQHVQQAGAGIGPRRSGDRKSNKRRPIPCRDHDGVAVGGLPPHLALGKRARTPLPAFELEHPRAKLAPERLVKNERPHSRRHQRLVMPTTRASPARSLITLVSPPIEY